MSTEDMPNKGFSPSRKSNKKDDQFGGTCDRRFGIVFGFGMQMGLMTSSLTAIKLWYRLEDNRLTTTRLWCSCVTKSPPKCSVLAANKTLVES